MNVFDTNREECHVATTRLGRTNGPRHNRTWAKTDAFTVKTITDIAGKTTVCLVEVMSPSTSTLKKQRVFYTVDGTTPTQALITAGKAHKLTEEAQNYFHPEYIQKAKFAVDTTYITEQTKLVITELCT